MKKNLFKNISLNDFVRKVNEYYHDIEGKDYEKLDPEIFVNEKSNWNYIGKNYLCSGNDNLLKLLDIGSGTGFVPLVLSNFLSSEDTFVCSDISSMMLDICKNNISEHNFSCKHEFKKLNGDKLPFKNQEFDFIFLNSVVHHILDIKLLFNEINRILKKDEFLLIGHEPNSLFAKNFFFWYNYKFFSYFSSPKKAVLDIFKLIGLYEKLKKRSNKKIISSNQSLLNQINKKLSEENILNFDLNYDDLIEIIDFHSPTAGKQDLSRGINVFKLNDKLLNNFNIEYFKTYNHLSKLSTNNLFFKKYDSLLSKLAPKFGSLFFVVLRKNG